MQLHYSILNITELSLLQNWHKVFPYDNRIVTVECSFTCYMHVVLF